MIRVFLAVNDACDFLGDAGNTLRIAVFEDALHDLSENLEIGLLRLIVWVKHFVSKGHQFVDYFHDVLRVVSVLSIADANVVSQQKVELVALSIIYC